MIKIGIMGYSTYMTSLHFSKVESNVFKLKTKGCIIDGSKELSLYYDDGERKTFKAKDLFYCHNRVMLKLPTDQGIKGISCSVIPVTTISKYSSYEFNAGSKFEKNNCKIKVDNFESVKKYLILEKDYWLNTKSIHAKFKLKTIDNSDGLCYFESCV